MKVTGITAEYNPLHSGHVYHIEKARETTGCDAIAVALSGDFVQRGAPAVADKWTRAEHALRCGADLVIEIPVLHCLGNAGQYASAGVKLLESLGCTEYISFGSECGDTDRLIRTAAFLRNNAAEIQTEIRSYLRNGLSYPAAREKAYETLGGDPGGLEILRSPNDILALEYIMAAEQAVPAAVRRQGAGYHQDEDTGQEYQSASGIRQLIREGADISRYVPGCVSEWADDSEIRDTLPLMDDALFDMIRYSVLSCSPDVIDDCPSGGEGLGNLIRSEMIHAESTEDLIMRVKSKRYTYTRISRLLMQILLGITRTEYYTSCAEGSRDVPGPGYIRVLGFNDRGRAVLSEIRKNELCRLPVITNINKEKGLLSEENLKMLELDVHAADIYNLISGAGIRENSDHIRTPVYVKQF